MQLSQAQSVQNQTHHSVNIYGVSTTFQAVTKNNGACSKRALILVGEMANKSKHTNKICLLGILTPGFQSIF